MNNKEFEAYKQTIKEAEAEIARLEHLLDHELTKENIKTLAEICQDLTSTIHKANQFTMTLALKIDSIEARLNILEGNT